MIRNVVYPFYGTRQLVQTGETFIQRHKITNTYHTGVYSLFKAFISEILPTNLSHVILIDTENTLTLK